MTPPLARAALLLALAQPAAAATLVDTVRATAPPAILDHLIALGRTIDLADPTRVAAAIGPVQGLPTRRSGSSAFAGYTLPAGEIVYNPDAAGSIVLLVSLATCIPAAEIRRRLHEPDFTTPSSRIDVALYTDIPYAARPGTSVTFHEGAKGCVTSIGIRQRSPAA